MQPIFHVGKDVIMNDQSDLFIFLEYLERNLLFLEGWGLLCWQTRQKDLTKKLGKCESAVPPVASVGVVKHHDCSLFPNLLGHEDHYS